MSKGERQTLDQRRCEHALQQVEKMGQDREIYTAMESLPGKLRVNGLLVTVAYLAGTKEVERIHQALTKWLTDEAVSPIRWGNVSGELMDRLTKCSAETYAIAMEETVAYAGWLKQWAKVRKPEMKP